MKLEEQVSSLELSKKLKDLGVEQESLYMWADDILINPELGKGQVIKVMHNSNECFNHIKRIASAFTVAELGEMLPYMIGKYYLEYSKIGNSWIEGCTVLHETAYVERDTFLYLKEFREKNESDARAKMLIWLIENKKVKA